MRSDLITIQNNEVPYVAGDGRAIEEAVRLACIRLGKHEAGLFARGAEADFPQRWNAWMVDEWPSYEVCLHRAYRAAVDFKFEGILQADADLSAL